MKLPAFVSGAIIVMLLAACGPSAAETEFEKLRERETTAGLTDLPVISREYRELARKHPDIRERAMRQADQVDARHATLLQRNEQIYQDNLRKYGQ